VGETTGIAWTDATINFWQGCEKISPGCKFCYMFRDKKRYGQNPNVVIRSAPPTFNKPLLWAKDREKYAHIKRVFTCSWSDFFIEDADDWRDEAWDIIRRTPELTYQILTKRPERIMANLPADFIEFDNVWLGISGENQEWLDKRMPDFYPNTYARVAFLSLEPLLGPINIIPYASFIDWVISVASLGRARARRILSGCATCKSSAIKPRYHSSLSS
jgi:protein gp37